MSLKHFATDSKEMMTGLAMVNPSFEPRRSVRNFIACIVIMAIIWLGVLPLVTHTASFQKYDAFLEERHINPSAMYYSELECLPDVLNRLQEATQSPHNETDAASQTD
jgi:hypothetical protein